MDNVVSITGEEIQEEVLVEEVDIEAKQLLADVSKVNWKSLIVMGFDERRGFHLYTTHTGDADLEKINFLLDVAKKMVLERGLDTDDE